MVGQTLHRHLRISPNAHTIGAEVEGLDFAGEIPQAVSDELLGALRIYGVLVARKTNADDASVIALARQWGEMDNVSAHIKAGRQMRFPELPEIFDVSNLTPDGKIIPQSDELRISSARGNALWHADGAYNPRRSGLSIIRAIQLPPKGTGGETEFLDSRTAYEDLPTTKKKEIEPYVSMNTLLWNRIQANPDMEMFQKIDCTQVPLAKHRIAQIHEPTGRGNLYIGSYAHHIENLPVEEGRRIIDDLIAHVTQEKYFLKVHYENPGDLVFWDNTAVLHRATVGAYNGKYVRDMRRVSTFDDSIWAWGENDPASAKQVGLT